MSDPASNRKNRLSFCVPPSRSWICEIGGKQAIRDRFEGNPVLVSSSGEARANGRFFQACVSGHSRDSVFLCQAAAHLQHHAREGVPSLGQFARTATQHWQWSSFRTEHRSHQVSQRPTLKETALDVVGSEAVDERGDTKQLDGRSFWCRGPRFVDRRHAPRLRQRQGLRKVRTVAHAATAASASPTPYSDAAIVSDTRSAAATSTASRWCTYRFVTVPPACPSMAPIVLSL